MKISAESFISNGIIKPSGDINKNKINLVAGAITQPFAEMVWVTTDGDMETINRLTDILVSMNTSVDRGKLFKIIKILFGLWAYSFPRKPPIWTLTRTYWITSSLPERPPGERGRNLLSFHRYYYQTTAGADAATV